MPRRPPLRAVVLAVLGALLVPVAALSATPEKGRTYVGTRGGGSTSVTKKVSLKVAADGHTATALLYCGSARQPSAMPRFAIRDGRFKAAKKQGSITLWTLSGTFTSKTKAVATLHPVTTCDGKGGPITLLAKAAA